MPERKEMESLRLDKYLWAVRLYKTRSLATEACRAGRIRMGEQSLKASHEVKVGEIYEFTIEQLHRRVQVKGLPPSRVGAKLVELYLTDLTPAEEYERMELVRQYHFEHRDRGAGRPTKRDRRAIEQLKQ